MDPDRPRCTWVGEGELYVRYHDEEWGVPEHDGRRLFELLALEGAQAGLSWLTVLRRREGYRRLFAGFDPRRVAAFDDDDLAAVLADPGIVRHRQKVASVVANAHAILALGGGDAFADFVWDLGRAPGDSRAVAMAMSRRLRREGFAFVGPTICHSFMQSAGMVNEHDVACFRFEEVAALAEGSTTGPGPTTRKTKPEP
jgi:DNA-3-methyladenine glycosylase I